MKVTGRAKALEGICCVACLSLPTSVPQEKAKVRASAIFLFGDVIYSGGRKFQQPLKKVAFQALVPLLFHLADAYKEVVMVSRLPGQGCQGSSIWGGPRSMNGDQSLAGPDWKAWAS